MRQVDSGFEVQVPPLFVRDISVGDVLSASFDEKGDVASFRHVSRSGASTIWLLRLEPGADVMSVMAKLRATGCLTVALDDLGCYAASVPESVAMSKIDPILDVLDSNAIAVAFPSFRHPESE